MVKATHVYNPETTVSKLPTQTIRYWAHGKFDYFYAGKVPRMLFFTLMVSTHSQTLILMAKLCYKCSSCDVLLLKNTDLDFFAFILSQWNPPISLSLSLKDWI